MKSRYLSSLVLVISAGCQAFSPSFIIIARPQQSTTLRLAFSDNNEDDDDGHDVGISSSRRQSLRQLATTFSMALSSTTAFLVSSSSPAQADILADREKERKYIQESYSDFTKTNEGWQYREVKPGAGEKARQGDKVVFEWSGYTIGYFGRPFQAKGGPQGGAFDKDIDFDRVVIGSGKMIKGVELALKDMKAGEVRQVVIPYGELSYPEDDDTHDRVGPKPTTFSGQRALNFVLDNPRLDRTLLFNLKCIRVDRADGKGGFVRGG